jgi:lipoprotein-anchoring transpeptidase ErfK/SrfK
VITDQENIRNFRVVSARHDIPNEFTAGVLIPAAQRKKQRASPIRAALTTGARVVAIFGLSFFVSMGGLVAASYQGTRLATPDTGALVPLALEHLYADAPLQFGIQVALSQPDFFQATRDTFIANEKSFIEADLTKMEIRYYEAGVEVFTAAIASKGKEGSWWETPAGLYSIGLKKENHFSSFGSVYQPWSMTFQGNFFIHGWPYYPDGTPVPEGFSGGCIRLENDVAEELFNLVSVGTPVLVHEADFANDDFVYEPKIPELKTPHYLLADINNSTILASSDLDASAPIASVTKLMTALIAVEYINLDKNVTINYVPSVPSVIPRLAVGQTVSMYSLLQLLMVESSNEAAEYIAGIVGRERFIELMNKKAAALGLEHTTFTDPSGLDAGNVSSVSDLLRLSQYIYNNRSFILELTVNQDIETAYKKGQFGRLENFNTIDGVESFIGGKVGDTMAAGQTSVSFHRLTVKGEERVIVIILLGSAHRNDDIVELITYLRERFGGIE